MEDLTVPNFFIHDDLIINVDDIAYVFKSKYGGYQICFMSKRDTIGISGESFNLMVKFINEKRKGDENV